MGKRLVSAEIGPNVRLLSFSLVGSLGPGGGRLSATPFRNATIFIL